MRHLRCLPSPQGKVLRTLCGLCEALALGYGIVPGGGVRGTALPRDPGAIQARHCDDGARPLRPSPSQRRWAAARLGGGVHHQAEGVTGDHTMASLGEIPQEGAESTGRAWSVPEHTVRLVRLDKVVSDGVPKHIVHHGCTSCATRVPSCTSSRCCSTLVKDPERRHPGGQGGPLHAQAHGGAVRAPQHPVGAAQCVQTVRVARRPASPTAARPWMIRGRMVFPPLSLSYVAAPVSMELLHTRSHNIAPLLVRMRRSRNNRCVPLWPINASRRRRRPAACGR